MTYTLRGAAGTPQECETLAAAMHAAGHPGLADWQTEPGQPGLLFLAVVHAAGGLSAAVAPQCTIQAPGVAREFADTYPADSRACRRWSPCDERIITAVLDETRQGRPSWQLPHLTACRAGAWLAARYGTGSDPAGSVTTADVHAVVTSTYRAAFAPRAVPEDVADEIAAGLVRRLAAAQVTVSGAQAIQAGAATAAWPREPSPLPAAATRAPARQALDRAGLALAFAVFMLAAAVLAAADGAAGACGRRARQVMRPAWTIPVPATRIPAGTCRVLSHLISHMIIPLGVLVTGIALTCWPRPWQDWIGWLGAALLAGKAVSVELRPAARQARGQAQEEGQR